MEQFDKVTITNLGKGVVPELFERELAKVMKNIANPDTKATAKRKITLEIAFTPYEDRSGVKVSVIGKSTLASAQAVDGRLFLAMKDGKLQAYPHDINQARLFGEDVAPEGQEPQLKVYPLAKTS